MTNDDERDEASEDPQTLQRELQTQKRLAAELAWKLARTDADSARPLDDWRMLQRTSPHQDRTF